MDLSSAPTTKPALNLLLTQSRILEALAGTTVLRGTPDELIRQLEVSPEAFRAALHDLVEGGWIFATTTHDGRLTVGRERRRLKKGETGPEQRRSPASLWEGASAPLAR